MAEFDKVYKWHKPEGYYGLKCMVRSASGGDRVWLQFEDGRKLMRSKFSIVGVAKWDFANMRPFPKVGAAAPVQTCPTCGQKVKAKRAEDDQW